MDVSQSSIESNNGVRWRKPYCSNVAKHHLLHFSKVKYISKFKVLVSILKWRFIIWPRLSTTRWHLLSLIVFPICLELLELSPHNNQGLNCIVSPFIISISSFIERYCSIFCRTHWLVYSNVSFSHIYNQDKGFESSLYNTLDALSSWTTLKNWSCLTNLQYKLQISLLLPLLWALFFLSRLKAE